MSYYKCFSVSPPPPKLIPPWGSLPSSVPSFIPRPRPLSSSTRGSLSRMSCQWCGFMVETSGSRCFVWCFCVKAQKCSALRPWRWHHLQACPHVWCRVEPSVQAASHELKVWMEWTPVDTPADFLIRFDVFFQVDPSHKALWKHSHSSRRATKVRLTSCVDF